MVQGGDITVGDNVTVGHGCVIKGGVTLANESFVGMGAILGQGVTVESKAMVAAGAIVAPGTVVPAGQVWAGNPAKKLRDMSAAETKQVTVSAGHYVELAAKYI